MIRLASVAILFLLVSNPIYGFTQNNKNYHMDLDGDLLPGVIMTSSTQNSLKIYKSNDLILSSSNFTVDGYSTLKNIKKSDYGFYS